MSLKRTGGKQESGVRSRKGRFAPGESGNPAGRPRGSRNRGTRLVHELLDGEGEAIVKQAIAMAKRGDPVALRLCIERIAPRRANVVEVKLPEIRRAEDVAEAAAAVIEAAAAGDLTLQEAREFMQLLEGQRKTIETKDLAIRIELLEGGSAAPAEGEKEFGFVTPAERVRRLEAQQEVE